jgi:predicted nucleotidyltransferase
VPVDATTEPNQITGLGRGSLASSQQHPRKAEPAKEKINNRESEKNNYKNTKTILYGSYAKGQQRDHSDIDIAVISPHFAGKRLLEIQAELARVLSKYLAIVEPVGFTSEDFRYTVPRTLLDEIKKSGKILYSGQ